jgi:hypothetical protein
MASPERAAADSTPRFRSSRLTCCFLISNLYLLTVMLLLVVDAR